MAMANWMESASLDPDRALHRATRPWGPLSRFPPSLTKIGVFIGVTERSTEQLEELITAGMSVAVFNQSTMLPVSDRTRTIRNLRAASKPCAVMLDTNGPCFHVIVRQGSVQPIRLEINSQVSLPPFGDQLATATLLPVIPHQLAHVVQFSGVSTIIISDYLLTGDASSTAILEVQKLTETERILDTILCKVVRPATLQGPILSLLCPGSLGVPSLSARDKQEIESWGAENRIDILAVHARNSNDITQARKLLEGIQALSHTKIYAKIGDSEGVMFFNQILEVSDGVILSQASTAYNLNPPELFKVHKLLIHLCNMANKPVMVTNALESMVSAPAPQYNEARDVSQFVLDGCDSFMLGAQTYRGEYPIKTVSLLANICKVAEKAFDQVGYFERALKKAETPMSSTECMAVAVVRMGIQVEAVCIISMTYTGEEVRYLAKYRPSIPVLAVVLTQGDVAANDLVRQLVQLRAVFPIRARSTESALNEAISYGKAALGTLEVNKRIVCLAAEENGGALTLKILHVPQENVGEN